MHLIHVAAEPSHPPVKQAACLACRKSKIRCRRQTGSLQCDKCQNTGTECTIPSYHVGRQKGVKNKRTGLQKAIYQMEEAIRKSDNDGQDVATTTPELYRLLDEAKRKHIAQDSEASPSLGPNSTSTVRTYAQGEHASREGDEQYALDDAENPLQLLARASDLRMVTSPIHSEAPIVIPSRSDMPSETAQFAATRRFFLPSKARPDARMVGLGNMSQSDPIDIGLVTLDEAEHLISYFHANLAHTRWGLDPHVHGLDFMRSQSSFLFTSVLAASALFVPSAGALAKRLSIHSKAMAQKVIADRLRSVEVVLAFMVNIPWMPAGAHSTDDDTNLYLANALSIALDLSMDKITTPSTSFSDDLLRKLGKAECIDGDKALIMDGFDGVDAHSKWGQRLLRRRERAWVALFVLERGVCLARGRSYCVPITSLVRHCDCWSTTALAMPGDASMISMAVLRRDLDQLFTLVRTRCDHFPTLSSENDAAEEINSNIGRFFDKWMTTWYGSIAEGPRLTLPPYVEILVTHTRLSAYCSVMNHPTAPTEVKRVFRASALSASLNVLRAAIQGEVRLKSMPNNTATMISFAAAVALHLTMPLQGGEVGLAPSTIQLIRETSAVLDRVGRVTPHRNGASIYFAAYLQDVLTHVSTAANMSERARNSNQTPAVNHTTELAAEETSPYRHQPQQPNNTATGIDVTQPLQFSSMSDDEINEMISNAAPILDMPMPDMSSFDITFQGGWDWTNATDFIFPTH